MVPGCTHDRPTPGCIWCWSEPAHHSGLSKVICHDDERVYRRETLRLVKQNRHDRRKAEALKRRA